MPESAPCRRVALDRPDRISCLTARPHLPPRSASSRLSHSSDCSRGAWGHTVTMSCSAPPRGATARLVRVGAGRVLAVTTDPLSVVPALGVADSARLACRLVASDLWTSGIPPAYASVTLNLPPQFSDADLDAYASAMSAEWDHLGVAVVAGHTGRYDGCNLSIVGAATLFGLGDEGRWVGAPFVQPGDRVLMTKDCAVEATAIAARMFPKRLAERLDDQQIARRGRGSIRSASSPNVARPCASACAIAGVGDARRHRGRIGRRAGRDGTGHGARPARVGGIGVAGAPRPPPRAPRSASIRCGRCPRAR